MEAHDFLLGLLSILRIEVGLLYYEKEKDYIRLYLSENVSCKIDEEDLPIVLQYNWFFHLRYFYTRTETKLMALHSIIFKCNDKSKVVDHINRDRLDNRKSNLRLVSRSINATNAKIRSDKTQNLPRGVTYRPENKEQRKDGKGKKRYESFEVQWSMNGVRKTRTFSVKKYKTKEEAQKQAIKFREEKLKEMKI